MKNNQHNQIRTFLYLIQVQTVVYAVISQLLPIISFMTPPFLKLQVVLACDLVY